MAGPSTSGVNIQYVVVWEWSNPLGRWRPYSPYVSQSLERAYSKKLKKLMLGDTEPALSNYYVVFDRMEQVCRKSDMVHPVRRVFYPQVSPAGAGRQWEWCDNSGWKSYDMDVQFLIDDAHGNTSNAQLDLSKFFPHLNYVVDFGRMKQIRKETKYERDIRCVNIASYPIAKPNDQDLISNLADIKAAKTSKGLMGKLNSLAKAILVPNSPKKSAQANPPAPPPPAAPAPDLSQVPGSSNTRLRRPSSDTVSTYLSKDSGGVDSNENLVDVGTSKQSKPSTSHVPDKPAKVRPQTSAEIIKNSSWLVVANDEDCTICYSPLRETGGYGSAGPDCPVELERCGHRFHLFCLEAMSRNQTSIRCPNCNEIYGIRTGNMPQGTMTSNVRDYSLAGNEGSRTIEIIYSFSNGVQGPEHPNPGKPYYASGFPRYAYLPDTPQGRKALELLKVAFDRRLTFTIGRSVTTNQENVITWNEIHHKTSRDNRNGHGYPDPNFLDNLFMELAAVGIS